MRGFTGCCGLRGRDYAGLDFCSERWNARRAGLVAQQAGDAFGQEPLLPPPDRGLARAGAAGEFHRAATVRSQQHDLRPPDMLLRAVPIRHDGHKALAVGVRDVDGDTFAHPPDSHAQVSKATLIGCKCRLYPLARIYHSSHSSQPTRADIAPECGMSAFPRPVWASFKHAAPSAMVEPRRQGDMAACTCCFPDSVVAGAVDNSQLHDLPFQKVQGPPRAALGRLATGQGR